MIFAVLAIYMVIYLYQYFKSPSLDITTVANGTMDLTSVENGIIVRNETVVKNTEPGSIVYTMQNNQKGARGEEVALITDSTNRKSDNVSVLSNSNKTIYDYEENYKLYQYEVDKRNQNIKSYIDAEEITNFRELYLIRDYTENELSSRNRYLIRGDSDAEDDKIQAKERLNLVNPGIVNYNIDGYEELATYENIPNITKEYTEMSQTTIPEKSKSVVANDEPIYKTIDSNTWYIVSYIENEKLEDMQVGEYHKLYLNNGYEYVDIWFLIESIERGEKESKVVFKTTKFVTDFAEFRNIQFKLNNDVYEGLKIPTSAITQKEVIAINLDFVYNDDGTYVLKEVDESTTVKTPIEIWLRDSERNMVYLEPDKNPSLKVGDIFRKEGEEGLFQIQEITILDGVLKINSGFAEFKPIILEEEIPRDRSTTILNTKKNKYLKSHDKIVTFSNEIEENEKISR